MTNHHQLITQTSLSMEITALINRLQPHLDWHRARLVCCAATILALIKLRTVNLCQLALVLNPKAKTQSNERRLRRFLAGFELDFECIARLIVALIPQQDGFTITLDRTQWLFGTTKINILMIAIAYKGIAIPVVWMLLDKKGNSSTAERIALERIALMGRLLRVLPAPQIKTVLADREFIGKRWFSYLMGHGLHFVIRIKKDAQVGDKRWSPAARHCFQSLKVGQQRRLQKPRLVYGTRLYVVGKRLAKPNASEDEFIIVVTPRRPSEALLLYAERWQIETLFGALKSRGFDFEATHLRDRDRLARLGALLALAFVWAYLLGIWLHEHVEAIKLKGHGRRARSLFRYGLDYLRECLLNPTSRRLRLRWPCCLQVLSGT